MKDSLAKLYQSPLPSFRSGLFFNTYAYPTKIAPESIAVFIATHTKPGDTVLDSFSGSGATGLAAQMCENPTPEMIKIADKLGANPIWGPRNAVLYDISTYGTFAANVMTNPPDANDFTKAALSLISEIERKFGYLYETVDDQGGKAKLRHVIWSSVLFCKNCGSEFTFYDGMVNWNPVVINSVGSCPHCGASVTTTDNDFSTETYFDQLLQKEVTKRRRVPVLIYGESNGRKWRRPANDADKQAMVETQKLKYLPDTLPREIKWGELHRSGYHSGITHLHHFYTKRNYIITDALWRETAGYEPSLRDALRLLVLSYNATHSTLMTRVVAKHNSSDFVLTGAQSGVLYVSNLPVEKNILKGLTRKIKPFAKAFNYINSCSGRVIVHNQSSDKLDESDGSIDYVFTDPPFGDFIPYAEVNQINELWLDSVTDRTCEAIISPSQNKNTDEYGARIFASLREAKRVLSDDGLMTLVFHSSKADVWQAFADAIEEAKMTVEATSHLAKAQDSFKQVVSAGSVKNDSLILLSKRGEAPEHNAKDTTFDMTAGYISERDAYAAYVNHCLESGLKVELDAQDFYAQFASHGAEI